jgi:carboxymethylenebutenolidase
MTAPSTPLSVHEAIGETKGGVIVLQEAFGVNDHIEDVCRRIAAAGYVAVAPHLFHRSGDPNLGYDDFGLVVPHMRALTVEGVTDDIAAAIDHLQGAGVPLASIGVVGFCMGGTLSLITATQRDVGAAVTYYGGGVTDGRFGFPPLIDAAPQLRAPWLGLYGDLDTGIPVDDVERLRTAAAASGQPTEIVRYSDAEHGFNCDRRTSYHAGSAAEAWGRMLAWFDTYLAALPEPAHD